MEDHKEQTSKDLKEFARRGFVLFILLFLSFAIWNFVFFKLPSLRAIFVEAIVIIAAFVILVMLRKGKSPSLMVYIELCMLAAALIFLHQHAGLLEDYRVAGLPILILIATFFMGWRGGLIITSLISASFILVVSLEYLKIIPGNSISGISIFQRMRPYDVGLLVAGRILLNFA